MRQARRADRDSRSPTDISVAWAAFLALAGIGLIMLVDNPATTCSSCARWESWQGQRWASGYAECRLPAPYADPLRRRPCAVPTPAACASAIPPDSAPP